MNILYSLKGIIGIESPGRGIARAAECELKKIMLDFSTFCSPDTLEDLGREKEKLSLGDRIALQPEILQDSVQDLLEGAKKAALEFPLAVAPYPRRNTKREDLKEPLCRLAEACIRACAKAGCHYLVVRPLFSGIERELLWEENEAFYMRLSETARENDVMVLLENQCRDFKGHLVRGVCAEGTEAAAWVDRLNASSGEERFGFCMDVGACNLCGQNMYEFATALGGRLKAVIMRDCDGSRETSLLPFTSVSNGQSRTDWLNLVRGLRAISFDGQAAFDLSDSIYAFPPLLRPHLLTLARKTGEYFKWQLEMERRLQQYDSIVLFGAGNMCRCYMKCYGREHPPLFTCDNNAAMWGSEFCGLLVKSPESLKELPATTAIFICNIYYKEITQQLRDMKLENPIEYFNDEYMPSFYFDRLEMWKDASDRGTDKKYRI